jgi:hypothetical protein
MSKTAHHDATSGDGGSIDDRLARLLDAPFLARVVPHLPPEALHQLIRSRGLDACAEVVTAATPAQLGSVLDLDLWRRAPAGSHDAFDADRFGEWLDALVDMGISVAARIVAALDAELVSVGLSRYVRVFDAGIFEPTAHTDDERIDRGEAMHEGDPMEPSGEWSGAGLTSEVGGYVVRARRTDSWDAILALLVALDAEHVREFQALMRRCRSLSNSRPEVDGLDDLLPDAEQQLYNVASDRERRRSMQGYATPADARAFLEAARRMKEADVVERTPASTGGRAIAAAYFRLADVAEPSAAPPPRPDGTDPADVAESLDAVMALLAEAGALPERPRALLEAADADPQQAGKLARLRPLLTRGRDTDDTTFLARSRELAFLANTLLAGCSVQARPFTPQEASDAAAAICNLGLECWPAAAMPASWLLDHDLVSAFELGWSVLHRDVAMFAAEQLISTLGQLRVVDRDTRRELVALRRALAGARATGAPWRAREAADVLALLDAAASISVRGLLDECPVLPAALTAILEGRTTTVSATAFEFISTRAQIADVRLFMRRLPGILG